MHIFTMSPDHGSDQPYHRLLPNGEWSEETYKTREATTKALLAEVVSIIGSIGT